MAKKTLVVGFDAACWEYLNPLLQAGQLPVLCQLVDAGVWGVLQSTLPAWTPTAWASIVTGKNPGKHGVFGMMWRRPGTYEFSPTSARVRAGTPFWKRLNDRGIRVGLVNVPFTYPPDPVQGFVLCGFGTPDLVPDITYPQEVLAWIKERFGDYHPAIERSLYLKGDPRRLFDAEREHQARLVQIATELSQEHQVDVLVINLMLLDHANHYMPDMTQVEEAICQMDMDLNSLLEGFRPDNVLVVSDHGSRRVKGQFLLYNWLLENGYCVNVEREPLGRLKALNHILMSWVPQVRTWPVPVERAMRALLRTALLRLPTPCTEPVWNSIERAFPSARRYFRLTDRIDYRHTMVFPESQYSGLLYFNLAQREPHGKIPLEERDKVAAELVERLSRLEDPDTKQPVFSGIYVPGELYEGPAAECAPDLILDGFDAPWGILSSYHEILGAELQARFFLQHRGDVGQHSRDGIFVFSGRDFAEGPALQDGHVMDIPATLLYLYGVPIPDDYDGRVMVETVHPESVEKIPVTFQAGDPEQPGCVGTSYSAEEATYVMDHLRALGYVE
jgi:predicted AlkP superfamily phosphohydrolase/phosphomutase